MLKIRKITDNIQAAVEILLFAVATDLIANGTKTRRGRKFNGWKMDFVMTKCTIVLFLIGR